MPRPKLNRKSYTATMTSGLLGLLDRHAKAAGQTRSDVIEDAVKVHLDVLVVPHRASGGRPRKGKQ